MRKEEKGDKGMRREGRMKRNTTSLQRNFTEIKSTPSNTDSGKLLHELIAATACAQQVQALKKCGMFPFLHPILHFQYFTPILHYSIPSYPITLYFSLPYFLFQFLQLLPIPIIHYNSSFLFLFI